MSSSIDETRWCAGSNVVHFNNESQASEYSVTRDVLVPSAKGPLDEVNDHRHSRASTPFSHSSRATSSRGSTITEITSYSHSSRPGLDIASLRRCPDRFSSPASRASSRATSPHGQLRKLDHLMDDSGPFLRIESPLQELNNTAVPKVSYKSPESDREDLDSDYEDEDPEWSGGQDEIEMAVLSSISDLGYAAQLIMKLHKEYDNDNGNTIDYWQRGVRYHGANDATQANRNQASGSDSRSLQQENPRKRRRGSSDSIHRAPSDDEDADEEDGDEQPPTGMVGSIAAAGTIRLLACPFHKLDPTRYCNTLATGNHYRVCASGFKTIQRLKEHIERKHYPVQCERCFKKFTGPAKERARCLRELKAHRQQPEGCPLEDPALKEGISDEQWENLKGGNGKRMPKSCNVEKWFNIWEVLFPEEERPEHPWYEQAGPNSNHGKPALGDQQRFFKLFENKLKRLLKTDKVAFLPGREEEMKQNLLEAVRETCTLYNRLFGLGASSSSSGQTCMQKTEIQTPETSYMAFNDYQKGSEMSSNIGPATHAVPAPGTGMASSIAQSALLAGLNNPSMFSAQNPQNYGLGFPVPRYAPTLQGITQGFSPNLGDMDLDLDFGNGWASAPLSFQDTEGLAYVMSRNDLHEMPGQ